MKKILATLTNVLLLGGIVMAKEVATEIKVRGMTCGSCVVSVKKALSQTKGVKNADVSLEKAEATVVYDDAQVNQQQLRDAIKKAGFEAELKETK